MDFQDYYSVMGVDRDVSQDEIKRAYKKLARKYHPDVSKDPDAETRFKEVGEAYSVLKDPEKRAAYDQIGANRQAGEDFTPPPGWDAGFEYSNNSGQGDTSGYSDFFESLFGHNFRSAQGSSQAGQGRGYAGFNVHGEDHHAKVLIDLEDAYSGATRSITLNVSEVDDSGHIITKQRTLNVKIPKGVKQGQKIRLAGQGSPSMGGGQAGNLYLEIEFNPHSNYRVDAHDVYLDVPITPWEAALGASIKVPTLDGIVSLKIPAGSVTGKKMRLRGRGIPGKPPGDFYVVPQITLPPADSETAKELYRQMEKELAYNPRSKLGV